MNVHPRKHCMYCEQCARSFYRRSAMKGQDTRSYKGVCRRHDYDSQVLHQQHQFTFWVAAMQITTVVQQQVALYKCRVSAPYSVPWYVHRTVTLHNFQMGDLSAKSSVLENGICGICSLIHDNEKCRTHQIQMMTMKTVYHYHRWQ